MGLLQLVKRKTKDILFKLIGDIDFYPSMDEVRFIYKNGRGYYIIREDIFLKIQRKSLGLEENK